MLYELANLLKDYDIPGQGLFTYLSFRAIMAAITALLIAIFAGRGIIGLLQRLFIDMFDNDSDEGVPTEFKQGAIIFSDNSAGFPMPQFAIVCVYDPDFE